MKSFITFSLFFSFIFLGCKNTFLEAKPSSDILTPNTLADLQGLLERVSLFNSTGVLPHISSDEYLMLSDQELASLPTATQRNAYLWVSDLFEGEAQRDWDQLYSQIFCANNVINLLNSKQFPEGSERQNIKGWAHFNRAYAYFDLVKNFSSPYSKSTAASMLGLPLRRSPEVDVIEQRSSLETTFEFIEEDLKIATAILSVPVPIQNRNRPSRVSAFAMLARVNLYKGDFVAAEKYADSCLFLHNALLDYNTVSKTSTAPFSNNVVEIIYHSTQLTAYSLSTGYGLSNVIMVNPDVYGLYANADLRKTIFFVRNNLGHYNMKRGYSNSVYPFTGLTTAEVLLIKAECLARRNETLLAAQCLESLLLKRYVNGQLDNVSTGSSSVVLERVLLERRKELIWRGMRWYDLKRLAMTGQGVELNRTYAGKEYKLPVGDPRWVFPIPDQEIIFSGIEQNKR